MDTAFIDILRMLNRIVIVLGVPAILVLLWALSELGIDSIVMVVFAVSALASWAYAVGMSTAILAIHDKVEKVLIDQPKIAPPRTASGSTPAGTVAARRSLYACPSCGGTLAAGSRSCPQCTVRFDGR